MKRLTFARCPFPVPRCPFPVAMNTSDPRFGPTLTYFPHLAQVAGGVAAAIFCVYWLERVGAGVWAKIEPEGISRATGLTSAELSHGLAQLHQRGVYRERQGPAQGFEACLEPESLLAQVAVLSQAPQPIAPVGDAFFPVQRSPRPAPAVAPNYQFVGPWRSPEELAAFGRALLAYFVEQGDRHPDQRKFWVIDGITKGIWSPFWDEFAQGQPLGSSQKVQRDWEIQPGVAYPAFEEERVQYYVQKGEPLEAAVARARADLRNPVLAQDLWDGFLRKCDRLADQAIAAQKQGVASPYLPPAFSDRPPITKAAVMAKLNQLEEPPPLPPESPSLPLESAAAVPRLELLQQAYRTKLGRNLIAQQIAKHPEWGYEIINDQIVDRYPF